MFGRFFPPLSVAIATIASMGTFAAAFLSWPLGAVVFGYFGDRLGRKQTLVATLLIMGLSTVTVGLVPNRYTESALAINIASVVDSALPPLIAGMLQATYGGWAIGVMLGAFALVSMVCTWKPTEQRF